MLKCGHTKSQLEETKLDPQLHLAQEYKQHVHAPSALNRLVCKAVS
jgi:hypothetical protein